VTLTEERLHRLEAMVGEALAELERQRREWRRWGELAAELNHVAREALESAGSHLAALEQAGYPEFLRASLGVVDRVVTSFDRQDVEALGDNIVLILQTVREMTQPEVMQLLRTTAHSMHDPEPADPPSLWQLLRRLRSREGRRGLSRALHLLQSMGAEQPSRPFPHPSKEA
jgi:uncharacterized protein YjgD (DUF1641 family)